MAQSVRSTVLGGIIETPDSIRCESLTACFYISSSWDQIRQQYVAVKKILEPFRTPATTQYIFREIKLLKHLQHENVLRPLDIFISPTEDMCENSMQL
ncbi:uncharacterized protein N7529_001992 [Penicillium soppii]|uniref:uncharacterized protein n=1 Tax=Penicillium soppii TaxID=69789 RepID=UPI002546A25D|nr:uncharacterized protein N7529_001992 [Penicillium soppii]KAJ5876408.1 hypothetical protein N7529_001992 [Penicillium soppii]